MTSYFLLNRFDNDMMIEARRWAELISPDPTRKVGCIIVNLKNEIVAQVTNKFPEGIEPHDYRLHNKTEKCKHMLHAEIHALLKARQDVLGFTMYITNAPCVECAKAIIEAGILRVVFPAPKINSSWAESQQQAVELFTEAGVFITMCISDC